jgi:hypothetical protein
VGTTEPVDVGPPGKRTGRPAVVADPAGAAIGVWEPHTLHGAELVNAPGSWDFSDLQVDDARRGAVFADLDGIELNAEEPSPFGRPILIKSSSAQLGGPSSSSWGPPARTKEVTVQILIVNFNLDGLSEEEFASSCDELAPAFAAVPGLASKVWLADRAEGIYGGVYAFESERAVDDFLQSDLFAGVGSTPGLVNISVRRFGVLDGPTCVTRGLADPAGV